MAAHLEVRATWRGGYATDVSARTHSVRVDEPPGAGGGDSGMMPTELFCAALASCFCLAVGHVAAKRSIVLDDLEVVVRATRAGRELRYEHFDVETRAAADGELLAGLIERARPFCWVSNALDAGVELGYRATSLNTGFRK